MNKDHVYLNSIICPECGNNEFKKEYKTSTTVECYCTKCGLILKKDDLAEEYDDNGWLDRGFRPNSWDICYTNHAVDYFVELPVDSEQYNNDELDELPGNFSRLTQKGEGNLSEDDVFQEKGMSYEKFLLVNSFEDTDESKLKYLRRYNQYEFNKCLDIIGNSNIVKRSNVRDVSRPKYDYER